MVEAFRNEFHNVGGPEGSFSTLGGSSSRILNNSDDLMALHKEVEEDRLTSFLRYYFSVLFVVSQSSLQPLAVRLGHHHADANSSVLLE